jgi:hypothetical protein
MPVTDIDDRALHIVPEDDDSVAGRLVPREADQAQNDENEDAPAIIEDPANREEEDEEACAMQKLKRID